MFEKIVSLIIGPSIAVLLFIAIQVYMIIYGDSIIVIDKYEFYTMTELSAYILLSPIPAYSVLGFIGFWLYKRVSN